VQGNHAAGAVANQADDGRETGPRIPMRQIRMEQEVARWRDREPSCAQIGLPRCAGDRDGPGEDDLDFSGRVFLRPRGSRRRFATRWRRGRPSDQIGGIGEEVAALEAGRLFKRAQRPAALAAVEVDPVAGVLASERDHAGAVLSRRRAIDIGKTPFVAVATAVREVLRHPGVGPVTQASHDGVEVVMDRGRSGGGGIVEVNQGSPALAPRA